MTHGELVERGRKWAYNTVGCRVVLTEVHACLSTGECPDVIGWKNRGSYLIECKTSRSDFHRDKKKAFRKEGVSGLGNWRIYLTPPGLLDGLNIPSGWGWYEVHPKTVKYAGGWKFSNCARRVFKAGMDDERRILISALGRCREGCEITELL